jgi:mono/diheme cytochrome c family protein
VHALLDLLRERSIERRARRIDPPDLAAPALVRQGAGNYDAMCASCHLAPGSAETELRRGLYPAPPALAKTGVEDPAEAFWAIKHGIKSSGMPAWGRSMDDEAIWGLVALLQQLPKLDAASYRELVVSSQGHSHGPAEPGEHEHHH